MTNTSIIIVEYMTSINVVQATKNNEFLNLKIEDNSKIVISCNKKSNTLTSIMSIMKDI